MFGKTNVVKSLALAFVVANAAPANADDSEVINQPVADASLSDIFSQPISFTGQKRSPEGLIDYDALSNNYKNNNTRFNSWSYDDQEGALVKEIFKFGGRRVLNVQIGSPSLLALTFKF